MEGRFPKGMLVLLTDCTDISQEEKVSDWFDKVYLAHLSGSGTFRHPIRYRNTAERLGPGEPRYMTTLETDSEDLAASMREYRGMAREFIERGEMDPALETVVAAMFRATGPEFRSSGEARRTTGLNVLFSNCTDETKHREFNEWYNNVHVPHVLETGRYHTGYRYENVDPGAPEGRYLSIYETDNEDPGELSALMARERPEWIEKGLYTPYIERMLRAAYTKMGP